MHPAALHLRSALRTQTADRNHVDDLRRHMAHWHAVMPGRILDVAYVDLVREPVHSASIGSWRRAETRFTPLQARFEAAGIL